LFRCHEINGFINDNDDDYYCFTATFVHMLVKDETPFRYAHAEIRTQMVVIYGPTRYYLDHGGAPLLPTEVNTKISLFKAYGNMTVD